MISLSVRRAGVIIFFWGVGIFLLSQTVSPKLEGPERASTVRQMLAAGSGVDVGSVGVSSPPASSQAIVHAPVAPVIVDMASLPMDAPVHNTAFELWKTGQLDWEASESKLTEDQMLALRQASENLTFSPAIQQAKPFAPTALVMQGSFEAIDYTECCGGSGSVPPDPELAVGDNHVIAVTNVAYQIYSLDGTPLIATQTFANLFGSVAGCNSADNEPPVRSNLFDPQRFV